MLEVALARDRKGLAEDVPGRTAIFDAAGRGGGPIINRRVQNGDPSLTWGD